MLNRFYESRQSLFLFSTLLLMVSFALSAVAVFGTISRDVHYLAFLPPGFMFFVSALFGFLVLADEEASEEASMAKRKAFFSIEAATALFALLLLPLCWWFVAQAV